MLDKTLDNLFLRAAAKTQTLYSIQAKTLRDNRAKVFSGNVSYYEKVLMVLIATEDLKLATHFLNELEDHDFTSGYLVACIEGDFIPVIPEIQILARRVIKKIRPHLLTKKK